MKALTKMTILLATAFCTIGCAAVTPQVAAAVSGDVNGDSSFDLLDVVKLQKWMLGISDMPLGDWKAADFCEDGVLDIFDLAMMKRSLLENDVPPEEIPAETDTPTETDAPAAAQSGLYEKIMLCDTENPNILAYSGVIPSGWTAELQSQWRICNAYPGRETAVFTSPDGKARVEILSPIGYSQDAEHSEGESWEGLCQFRAYQTAEAYADAEIAARYGEDAALTEEIDILPMQQEALEGWNQRQVDALQSISYYYELQGAEVTAARRQYRTPEGVAEIACGVTGIQYGTTVGMLTEYTVSYIAWEVPYTVLYTAQDEESFAAYYHDYEIIACNCRPAYDFLRSLQAVYERMTDLRERYYDDFPEFFAALPMEEYMRDEATEQRETMLRGMMQGMTDGSTYLGSNTLVRTADPGESAAVKDKSIYIGSETEIPEGYTALPKQHRERLS